MSAHTPGPWVAYDPNEGTEYFPCHCVANDAFHNPRNEDDRAFHVIIECGCEADAHLIAAAPELLAACRAAEDLLVRCDAETRPNDLEPATDEDWNAVLAQLRAAIAKATRP